MRRINDNLTYTFMFATILIIIVIMGIKFWWDFNEQEKQLRNELLEKAQVITKQQAAVWDFMIINQDRINYDSQGSFEFKNLNCSTVAMGVGALLAETTDYRIKLTNIICRNTLNIPDTFELTILNRFQNETNLQEYWAIDTIDDYSVFRYMTPLRIEESCLSCHGEPQGELDISGHPKEGFKVGDLGGAISLVMPMDIFLQSIKSNILSNAIFFLLLILVFIVSIYFLVTRLVTSSLGELEKAVALVGSGNLNINLSHIRARGEIKRLANHFQAMAKQLKDLYSNLESEVENRTVELEEANKILLQHQDELKKANYKLIDANHYKSEFLAIMSHELRTPLTSIIAFTEMLAELPARDKRETQYLQEIKTSSQILVGLINNILDMAKIEAGKTEIIKEVMDLGDVFASVAGVLMPLAKNKEIQLTFNIQPEVPLFKADPEKIRRIVENLVGNAIKFTNNRGRVCILADYNHPEQEIIITVEDTGIGIKREDLHYIFNKFTQSDSSISRKYGGTGLGLALVKELVELHNGWIKVDSTLNKGTTFTVGLPTGENLEGDRHAQPEQNPAG